MERRSCGGKYLRRGLLLAVIAAPLTAQLVIKLSQQTLNEFEHYVQTVENELNARWSGQKPFLALDEDPAEKQRVLAGELFIQQMNKRQPVSITDGLIHDWFGAIFIPRNTPEQVIQILEDFDSHKHIYPEISRSRTVSRSGFNVTGAWRLQQKGLVPVILDVEDTVHFALVAPGKWKGIAYARDIHEVDTGLFSRGREYPVGEGHGYLWRLYAYWSLEVLNGGVVAECRTLSLSRDIPTGLGWAVGPYVQKQPRESLASTLTNTRKVATR
ncbi:MAG TPA: hypothetical protein VHZ55_35325 [Bryobacteraceae bacterium]|jgi:hypothetical protein|nr:hypothetical protein [Bryobacteraceae bacterium]